jgi:hypothetical protein
MYGLIAMISFIIVLILGVIGPFNKRLRTLALKNLKYTILADFYNEVQDYIDGDKYVKVGELSIMYLFYLVCLVVVSVILAVIWPLIVTVLGVGSISAVALKSIRNKNK